MEVADRDGLVAERRANYLAVQDLHGIRPLGGLRKGELLRLAWSVLRLFGIPPGGGTRQPECAALAIQPEDLLEADRRAARLA
jgi:hypothetical protein